MKRCVMFAVWQTEWEKKIKYYYLIWTSSSNQLINGKWKKKSLLQDVSNMCVIVFDIHTLCAYNV